MAVKAGLCRSVPTLPCSLGQWARGDGDPTDGLTPVIIFGGTLRGGGRSPLLRSSGFGRHAKWIWGDGNESGVYNSGDFIVRLIARSWHRDSGEQGTLVPLFGRL